MKLRSVLVLSALAGFLVLLSASFIDIPWSSGLHTVELENATTQNGVANDLFGPFVVTVFLIALLLTAAMIGGVYLAKTDDQP